MKTATANRHRWMTVNRDYTVLDCGAGVSATLHDSIGSNLWDAFPGSHDVFHAHYERAFRDGSAAATVFYFDVISNIYSFRREDGNLYVAFESVQTDDLIRIIRSLGGGEDIALFDCPDCGLGGDCCPVPEHGADEWPECHECGANLVIEAVVPPETDEISRCVSEIQERFGRRGMSELACLSLSQLV